MLCGDDFGDCMVGFGDCMVGFGVETTDESVVLVSVSLSLLLNAKSDSSMLNTSSSEDDAGMFEFDDGLSGSGAGALWFEPAERCCCSKIARWQGLARS